MVTYLKGLSALLAIVCDAPALLTIHASSLFGSWITWSWLETLCQKVIVFKSTREELLIRSNGNNSSPWWNTLIFKSDKVGFLTVENVWELVRCLFLQLLNWRCLRTGRLSRGRKVTAWSAPHMVSQKFINCHTHNSLNLQCCSL